MRILIVPMAAMAETSGPSSRCRLLAEGFRKAGIGVAFCMAEDVNYRVLPGVKNYFLDVPMPFGLPAVISSRTFPLAQKLGIVSKKTVDCFDQVLWFTGNLDYRYLKKSTASVRRAIQEYAPDIVYTEFNISAIIAAKAEGLPLYVTVSYPTQYEYAHNAGLAKGLNRLLRELQLPRVGSAVSLFDWADKSFCPSIRELEPIEKTDVYFCGSLKTVKPRGRDVPRKNKIVVYMGNGTVSASKTLNVIKGAFEKSKYQVYIASSYLKTCDCSNIHAAPRWKFDKLLDEAVLFINHGGQNSMADGLIHGVPQIIIPGKVFERKYNAKSISDNNAGITMDYNDFTAENIRAAAERIISSGELAKNAALLGEKLIAAGGVNTIISNI